MSLNNDVSFRAGSHRDPMSFNDDVSFQPKSHRDPLSLIAAGIYRVPMGPHKMVHLVLEKLGPDGTLYDYVRGPIFLAGSQGTICFGR